MRSSVMISAMRDDPTVVALVERARNGDQAAWDALVERYAPLVWAVCRRYGLAGADADDVGASVWLRLVERLETIREPAALPGWIATTTQRECLYLLRAKNRQQPVDDAERIVSDTEPSVDEFLLAQERHIALRAAFAELSQRCRELLSMLFADPPAPYAQISAALGMAVGAIGPSRQRCIDKLRASPAMAGLLNTAVAGLDGG
jgi:RNA polymerase sigma factor (sigma-70 family)